MRTIILVLGVMMMGCSATDFKGSKAEEGSSGTSGSPGGQTTPDPAKDKNPVSASDARENCDWARATLGLFASTLPNNGNINGLTGSGIYAAGKVHIVRDVIGSLILLGSGADAAIDSVSELYGSLIVCDMDIKSIDGGVDGSIIVVNGNVGNVTGVTGSVLVVDGNVTGNITNSTGSVLAIQ